MRNVPIALAGHYATGRTSLCLLTKVKCKDGTILAFTTLDAELTYDDGSGDGPLLYDPGNSFTPSEQVWVADLSVDQAEATGWIRDSGISEERIRAGLFDFAKFWVYQVNFMDLSQGHVLKQSGTTGETKFGSNSWSVEFRSKTQQLKQPLSDLYSLTCTVPFGSPPCGKTFDWDEATVTAVDPDEPDRIFEVATGSGWAGDGAYTLGVIRVTSGANAGAQMEVETHTQDSSGVALIALLLPLPYPIEMGDELEFREDCSKVWDDADHGCLHHWGNERALHFRGQPHIPVEDANSLQIPQAQTPRVPGTGAPSQNPE